jgi:hypothetical protein
VRVPLRHIAHVRSGDKGDTVNVLVAAYTDDLYPLLVDQLTGERFARHYAGRVKGPVTRFEVPAVCMLIFVAAGALGGGVSRSLNLDNYGKALSAALLSFEVDVPDHMAEQLVGPLP